MWMHEYVQPSLVEANADVSIPDGQPPFKFIFDDGKFDLGRVKTGDKEDLLQVFKSGFESPLTPPVQHKVVDAIREHPDFYLMAGGVTLESFPKLVEENPPLAIECLAQLLRGSNSTAYLDALVNMRVSLHTIEVVNRLTTTPGIEIPKAFLHKYISTCITTCENIQDKYMQNRLVRLFCAFLQSLLRNNIVSTEDLFAEVQSFCVEFSSNKEAASLYRIFKDT
jgi:hypothetical protein